MENSLKRKSFNIGNLIIGDGKVLIQSMGDHKTSDTDFLIRETNDLTAIGMDMMRFSVLDSEDAKALKIIKEHVSVPIIADIHFDYRLALEAIDSKVDKIRINPGNIGTNCNLLEVIHKAKDNNVPIRIGVNSGSLTKFRGKTLNKADDILLAMDETISVFEEENFDNLVLSLKSSDPLLVREIYEKAYSRYPYPLHIGLTESGFGTEGAIKSALGVYPLLKEGIGDTLRVSLADDRKEEIRACKTLLKLAQRRDNVPDLIVCPTCGRTLVDVKPISRIVEEYLDHVNKNIKVAIMGCPVNGVGEAKDADYGIAGSGKENIYLLFSKGKTIGLFEKEEALRKLFSLIDSF